MEDETIIALYQNRIEDAIQQTGRKYGDYCYSIAYRILQNREDSEEVVSDTWMKAWNAIPPARPQVLKLFLARITRNLALSRYRTRTAEKRGGGAVEGALEELAFCVGSNSAPDENLNLQMLGNTIQRFLDNIPVRDSTIFVRRYFFLEEMDQIAKGYGMTESAVRMRLSRTRKKLRTYLQKEGYEL